MTSEPTPPPTPVPGQPAPKGAPSPDVPDAPPPSGWHPSLSLRSVAVGGTAALVAILLILQAWQLPPFGSGVKSTENAYVRGQVAFISSQLSAYVARVHVQDFESVVAGQLLVELDDCIFQQRLAQARATHAQQNATLANSVQAARSAEARLASAAASAKAARANQVRTHADLARAQELLAAGSSSQRDFDIAKAADLAADAAVEQADAAIEISRQDLRSIEVARTGLEAAAAASEAALHLAEIDVQNTRIVAPEDGRLGEVTARLGQYATAGTQVTALVPRRVWVVANFKEAQTARIVPGLPAWFTVDGLAGEKFHARVERIAPATGSEFSVLRPDNASGNFTKVSQRLPIRLAIDPGQPGVERLRPGMSVVAYVDTAGTPKANDE
jgi:multidrug resistance efflux pump